VNSLDICKFDVQLVEQYQQFHRITNKLKSVLWRRLRQVACFFVALNLPDFPPANLLVHPSSNIVNIFSLPNLI
jgi:hypothetical protein